MSQCRLRKDPLHFARPFLGPTQPAIQWASGSFRVVKRQEREVNHSPPTSDKVKNEWSYTFFSPVCLHDVHRENFTFATVFCFKHSQYVLTPRCGHISMRKRTHTRKLINKSGFEHVGFFFVSYACNLIFHKECLH
jgi:hypothetical protein